MITLPLLGYLNKSIAHLQTAERPLTSETDNPT